MKRVVHFTYDWKPHHGGAEKLLEHLSQIEVNHYKLQFVILLFTKEKSIVSLGSKHIYSLNSLFKTISFCRTLTKNDLIHVHLFPSTYYIAIAKILGVLKSKVIITEHNSTNRRRKPWFRWLDYLMYAQYDAVISISEGVEKSLLNWLPSVKKKSYVVYNGIKIIESQEFTDRKGYPNLLSVGRLVEQKNYEQIFEILFPLIKELNMVYTIVGEGILRNKLEKLIQYSQLNCQVKLLGRIPNVIQEYRSNDVFIILSKWEGFGLACVEALSQGLRIIASDVEGMREILLPLVGKGVLLLNLEDSSENNRLKIYDFILESDSKENFDLRIIRAKQFDVIQTANGYIGVYNNLIENW